MKFILINAERQSVELIEAENFEAAKNMAGLKGLDFGGINPALHIAVYEYGLVEKPETQRFFAIRGQLFAGNAIVFRVDIESDGETINVTDSDLHTILSNVVFFDRVAEVLFAIKCGRVERPEMSVNGEVVWRWPDPHPYKERFGVA